MRLNEIEGRGRVAPTPAPTTASPSASFHPSAAATASPTAPEVLAVARVVGSDGTDEADCADGNFDSRCTNGRYDYVRFDLAGPSYVQFVSIAGYFWFSEFKIFVTSSEDAPDYDSEEAGLCYAATTTKQTTFSDTYACETYWLHGEFIYFIPNPSENNLMRLNEIEGRGRVAPTPAPVGDDDDDSVDQLDQGSAGAVVLFVAVGLVVLGGAVFGAVKLGKKTSKGAELDSRKAAANNKDDSFGVVSVGNPVGANAML